MSIFGGGTIRLRVLMPFPSNVISGPGVAINKTSGIWSVGLDIPSLADGGVPATPSNIFIPGYDTGLLLNEKFRLDNIIASATGIDARTPRGDANYSILITDRYIGLTAALTAVRTFTLPAASTVPGGRIVTIQDEVGGIAGANYLAFAPTGADFINGVNGSYLLKTTRGGIAFRSNGTDAWNVIVTAQRRAVADTAYTALQGDLVIAYTSIAAARVVTLPAASAFIPGQRLTIIDESGSCSAVNTISVARAGADTINGSASSQVINQARGYLALISDGVSKWTIVDSSTITAAQISDSTATGRALVTAANAAAGRTALTAAASGGNTDISSLGFAGGVATTTGINATGSLGAWTTNNWGKAIDIPKGDVVHWPIGAGSKSWGIGVDILDVFHLLVSNADGGGSAATDLLTVDASGNAAFSGNYTGPVAAPVVINGVTNAGDAAAGKVGEYLTANASGVNQPTSGTPVNVTSLALTAGDWDVTGSISFTPAGTTTVARLIGSLSLTTGVSGGSNSGAYLQLADTNLTTGSLQTFSIGMLRVSVSGATTVFLVANATFGVSTMAHAGIIRARRVR